MIDNVTGMREWVAGPSQPRGGCLETPGGPASLYKSLRNGKDRAPKASQERYPSGGAVFPVQKGSPWAFR